MKLKSERQLMEYVTEHHPQICVELRGLWTREDAEVCIYNAYNRFSTYQTHSVSCFRDAQSVDNMLTPLRLNGREEIEDALFQLRALETGITLQLEHGPEKQNGSIYFTRYSQQTHDKWAYNLSDIRRCIARLEETWVTGEVNVKDSDPERAFTLRMLSDDFRWSQSGSFF